MRFVCASTIVAVTCRLSKHWRAQYQSQIKANVFLYLFIHSCQQLSKWRIDLNKSRYLNYSNFFGAIIVHWIYFMTKPNHMFTLYMYIFNVEQREMYSFTSSSQLKQIVGTNVKWTGPAIVAGTDAQVHIGVVLRILSLWALLWSLSYSNSIYKEYKRISVNNEINIRSSIYVILD